MTKLKYLWKTTFEDGTVIKQPEDDRYSKHSDGAEWNPSAFRDILDYEGSGHVIELFELVSNDGTERVGVDLKTGEFIMNNDKFYLEDINADVKSRKLVYYRTMMKDVITGNQSCIAYNFGYEYKNEKLKSEKKIIILRQDYGK